MRIGAHVPVMGDYRKMADYAVSVGCECVQIFAKNARQYRFSMPSSKKVGEMREAIGAHPELVVYSHAAYLINLSGADPEIRDRSVKSLAGELAIAAVLGIAGVNTHVGNDKLQDADAAARRAATSIVDARAIALELVSDWSTELAIETPSVPPLILENSSGAGTQFGVCPTEMSMIASEVDAIGLPDGEGDELLWTCVDSAHAWGAGYDVSCQQGWDRYLRELDEGMGTSRLKLFHANDSLGELGSKKDRHEWVGKGRIGPAGFAYAMRCPGLSQADAILEVPGEVPEKDEVNVALLKLMRSGEWAGAV